MFPLNVLVKTLLFIQCINLRDIDVKVKCANIYPIFQEYFKVKTQNFETSEMCLSRTLLFCFNRSRKSMRAYQMTF